jgi:hypothetical protein
MMKKRVSLRRRFAAFAAKAACVGLIALLASCILGEPTGDLPKRPASRPTILRDRLIPSATNVVGTWPPNFIVPVELADPTASFEWAAFVDFNPRTDEGLQLAGVSTFEQSNVTSAERDLEIPIPVPTDLGRCHVIEVVVALALESLDNPSTAHTPRPPGGDSITWFYSGSGDLAGCPVLDAGLEAGRLDDAGEGGPQ